jgi:hypothetical protein
MSARFSTAIGSQRIDQRLQCWRPLRPEASAL